MTEFDQAVDTDGKPLPYSPKEVRAIVQDAITTGEILAVVVQKGDSLMVQVLGPPSEALVEALEQAATAYRRVVKGE